jgi:hypothetical protein
VLLFCLFCVATAGAGYAVELVFAALGLIPGDHPMQVL